MQVLKNVLETRSETRSFHGRVGESVPKRERESTREVQHITKRRQNEQLPTVESMAKVKKRRCGNTACKQT